MLKITNTEKRQIRSHWSNYNLKFKKDGTVLAQKTKGGAWGILYSSYNLDAHIEHIRTFKKLGYKIG